MDVIDILGGLLKKRASAPGRGSDVLKDIVGRGTPTSGGERSPSRPTATGPGDISQAAQELEDLLQVAHRRNTQRASPPAAPRPAAPAAPQPRSGGGSAVPPAAPNDRALILVRAMLNAAKCDGQVSPEEERHILAQVDSRSPETVQFLRDELAQPLNVREFAWSVPPGLEPQVYALSLMAINVDTEREAAYLRELAHGLRLPDAVRDQLHQKYGVPLRS